MTTTTSTSTSKPAAALLQRAADLIEQRGHHAVPGELFSPEGALSVEGALHAAALEAAGQPSRDGLIARYAYTRCGASLVGRTVEAVRGRAAKMLHRVLVRDGLIGGAGVFWQWEADPDLAPADIAAVLRGAAAEARA